MKELNIKSYILAGDNVILSKEDYDLIQNNSYLWAEKYKKLQEENSQLHNNIEDMSNQIYGLEQDIESLKNKNDTLLQAASCNINDINTEATVKARELERELTIANEMIERLRDEKIYLLNRIVELTDCIDRNDNEISELNEIIEHQEEEINDLKESNNYLKDELTKTKEMLVNLRVEYIDLLMENTQLKNNKSRWAF